MAEPTPLHYANGGNPMAAHCANCGVLLGTERAVASTVGGPRFFCKYEPGDNPEYSCYNQWKRSRH